MHRRQTPATQSNECHNVSKAHNTCRADSAGKRNRCITGKHSTRSIKTRQHNLTTARTELDKSRRTVQAHSVRQSKKCKQRKQVHKVRHRGQRNASKHRSISRQAKQPHEQIGRPKAIKAAPSLKCGKARHAATAIAELSHQPSQGQQCNIASKSSVPTNKQQAEHIIRTNPLSIAGQASIQKQYNPSRAATVFTKQHSNCIWQIDEVSRINQIRNGERSNARQPPQPTHDR